MPSALSRDTNVRASVVSANSLSRTTGALASLARSAPLAWFIVTSIWIAPRLANNAVSARWPEGQSIAARILSDNRLTPMAALSGAQPLAFARLGVGAAPAARYHDSSPVYSCRSPVGHFDHNAPSRPATDGMRFRPFAGAPSNRRSRPQPDLHDLASGWVGSAETGHSHRAHP